MRSYSVYGLTLSSDFPFSYPLPQYTPHSGSGAPHVHFSYADGPPVDWRAATLAYTASMRTRAGEPLCRIYALPDGEAIRISGVADYVLRGDTILCYPALPLQQERIELFFLGVALARWLERHDTPALHASAVATEYGAVAFAASNRGGKTSLAAAFMQGGFPLLTDDILALRLNAQEVIAYPAYPQMRMWPEHAGHFVGNVDDLDFVLEGVEKRRISVAESDLGRFNDQSRPLAVIYLPDRREAATTEIAFEPVARGEALVALIRHSFAAGFANAAKHQQQRLALLAPLVERVAVRRLVYPSGVEELARVRGAIVGDLKVLFGRK